MRPISPMIDSDADKSAMNDKPKRRLSIRTANQSYGADKRQRSATDEPNPWELQYDGRSGSSRISKHRPLAPGTTRSRDGSSSSDRTSLVDGEQSEALAHDGDGDGYDSRRTSDIPRSTASSVVAGPSTVRPGPNRHYTNPRWVTEADNAQLPIGQVQSSTNSSTSSSAIPLPPRSAPSQDDRDNSPPPSHMLSTGQPLVGPPAKTQAAFVGKLCSMLEDEEIRATGLLYWSNGGTTFTCPNPTEFSK